MPGGQKRGLTTRLCLFRFDHRDDNLGSAGQEQVELRSLPDVRRGRLTIKKGYRSGHNDDNYN